MLAKLTGPFVRVIALIFTSVVAPVVVGVTLEDIKKDEAKFGRVETKRPSDTRPVNAVTVTPHPVSPRNTSERNRHDVARDRQSIAPTNVSLPRPFRLADAL